MRDINTIIQAREKCYRCYRPLSSCMCSHVRPVSTETKFVILMHPKEFKKTKNGTGHLTHLSLPNSELYIDVDFTDHAAVNAIIEDEGNRCYLLYPGKESIYLNEHPLNNHGKRAVIFLIDSTWPCSIKMLRLSKNLQALPRLSFTHTKRSQFQIKEQPEEYCLSTIESTLSVLELLNQHGTERIAQEALEMFLEPFWAMVAYQLQCASSKEESVRFKPKEAKD